MEKRYTDHLLKIPTPIYERIRSTSNNVDAEIIARLEATIHQDDFANSSDGHASILTELTNLQNAYAELMLAQSYSNADTMDQEVWSKVEELLSLVEKLKKASWWL